VPLYLKEDGAWVQASRAYLKKNGVWAPATEVYYKDAGTWKEANAWDKTPPPSPLLQLEVEVDSKNRQYIKVGVQIPGASHNTDTALIRVNAVGTGAYPSSPTDRGYIKEPWRYGFPNEPWSDYYYNGYKVGTTKDHNTTTEFVYKNYPHDRAAGDDLKPGFYRFMAWSMDFDGNWSAGVPLGITVPDKGNPAQKSRTGRFEPHVSGTWRNIGGWTEGDLYCSNAPGTQAEVGAYYYGDLIPNVVGNVGTITPVSAKLRVTRTNDTGAPSSVVWARPSEVGSPGASRDAYWANAVKIGTVAKGQSVWLDLPTSWFTKTNGNRLRAIHIWPQDTTAAGYGVYRGVNPVEGDWIYGSIQLSWREGP
jgi:hypothetical protein